MKLCFKCNILKSLDEFYNTPNRPTGSAYCKSCFNEYCIKRWIQNKIDAVMTKGGECQDCHLKLTDSHYSVFEFHHLDPTKKDISWNKMRLRSKKSRDKELEKCVLLCANCHRIRHANF